MSEDAPPPLVTVLNAEEQLRFDSDEPVLPSVVINFYASFDAIGDKDADAPLQWSETLTCAPEPADPKNLATPGRFPVTMKWIVNLQGDARARTRRATVYYLIKAVGETGHQLIGPERRPLLIDFIPVTTELKLTRIMLHEFAKPNAPEGSADRFDPTAAEAFIETLSPQQKKLLLSYDVSSYSGNRLVVIITLAKDRHRPMCADWCQPWPTTVNANALFTVFHCRGPGKGATLICHTEHLVTNMANGDTRALLGATFDGMTAQQWSDRSNPKPLMFKVATMTPSSANSHYTLYNRVFRPDGHDVMPHNMLHGCINTQGCWMLFRNFNWPRTYFQKLLTFYTDNYRPKYIARKIAKQPDISTAQIATMVDDLATIGYDQRLSTDTLSSSFEKALRYDRNYAFLWFFHEVVGIKYTADSTASYRKQNPYLDANDWEVHGYQSAVAFPKDRANRPPSFNLPDEKTYNCFDTEARIAIDKSFVADDSLIRDNALGFKTFRKFIPPLPPSKDKDGKSLNPHISRSAITDGAWADLYIYREDGLELKDFKNYESATA